MDFLKGLGEDRRRAKEMERDLESRQAKAKIQLYLNTQRKMIQRLKDMARRALALGDRAQFERVGKQYLWTRDNISRWERYLLAVESVEMQVQQARLTGEFMRSLQGMSKSLLSGAGPKMIAETEKDLQMGISRAQTMEQALQYIADTMDQSIGNFQELGGDDAGNALHEFEGSLTHETGPGLPSAPADDALDARIEQGLKVLEQEMRKGTGT